MQNLHDNRVDDDSAGSNSDPGTPLDYAPLARKRPRLFDIVVVTTIIPLAILLGLLAYDSIKRQKRRDEHRRQMRAFYDASVRWMSQDTRIGSGIEITGVAADNKAGPAVLCTDGSYIAKIGDYRWPKSALGQRVIVTGILRFQEGAPVSPEEPTKRIPYPVLESATWSLATQPASSPR